MSSDGKPQQCVLLFDFLLCDFLFLLTNVVSLPGADVWGGDECRLVSVSETIVGYNGYLIKKAPMAALFRPLRLFTGGPSDSLSPLQTLVVLQE